MWSAAFLIFGVNLVYAEHHSLQYFYTATTGMADFPQFVALGMVDGKQIDYYDSVIEKNVLKQAWMEGTRDEKRITDIRRGTQASFSNNIKVAMERFNQTLGVHTVQRMYGCEFDDQTGETQGFLQDGYDGEDFLSLDFKELRYISPVQQGFPTVQKLNNNKANLEGRKQYLRSVCIEWLQKYLQYGKSSLQKTVSPQVSLLQKSSSSPVMCHATGFYPSGVTISWMRNGQDHDEDVDLGELLPNEDGTFQRTSTITVTPDEWKNNKFSCVVEHQGKTKTADEIRTNPGDSVLIGFIGIIVATVVIFQMIVVAMCIRNKRCMMYEKKEKLASACSNVKNTEGLKTLDSCPDPGYSSSLDSESDIGSVRSDSCDSTTTLLSRKMTANDTR